MPNQIIVVSPPTYTATTVYGSNTVPSAEESEEYRRFDELAGELIQIPKSEADEKRALNK